MTKIPNPELVSSGTTAPNAGSVIEYSGCRLENSRDLGSVIWCLPFEISQSDASRLF